MKTGAVIWVFACVLYFPWLARADVYRCSDSGKVVYSDKPCTGEATKVPVPSAPIHAAGSAPRNLQNEAGMGRVAVGMTTQQVLQAWGNPTEKRTHENALGSTERWTYVRNGESTDVFVRKGVVSQIGEPHAVKIETAEEEPPAPTAAELEAQTLLDEEQERQAKADERRFMRDGMTQDTVLQMIGPPAIIRVTGPAPPWGGIDLNIHWIYPPEERDQQTTTEIVFDRTAGHVIQVLRTVKP